MVGEDWGAVTGRRATPNSRGNSIVEIPGWRALMSCTAGSGAPGHSHGRERPAATCLDPRQLNRQILTVDPTCREASSIAWVPRGEGEKGAVNARQVGRRRSGSWSTPGRTSRCCARVAGRDCARCKGRPSLGPPPGLAWCLVWCWCGVGMASIFVSG